MPPWARRALIALLGLIAVAALGLAALRVVRAVERRFVPDPSVIATASLEGLRAQNRLSGLVASYVAVVTATQSRFGLSAQRTLILPGQVRYEVDLARLRPGDLRWDAAAHRLDVTLPPLELVGPAVDLARMRSYDGGGLLLRFSHVGEGLDAANRKAAETELMRQARQPVAMQIARDATRRAVERSFALPLRAAGLDARVRVRFPDEPGFPAEPDPRPMERSRSLGEIFGLDR
ncbi:DUF4230 domain-containing protein [Sphingomonas morindae]|uniref:DUF4230 domain-containing protein n=1 Tax=Sphingomonas morindae TaxID=1541170 RepID=A0ABY4X9Y6_9SPHN|nr:DUF4230 domain-containing protein [Sphingomonas morindae]USI73680.1 DUF4230 domain-containing protein [Sphingomonas morindae]